MSMPYSELFKKTLYIFRILEYNKPENKNRRSPGIICIKR